MRKKSALWYTYILECRDGTLYTGSTNDITKRLQDHNDGNGAKFTRSRLPVTLKFTEEFSTRSEALKSEAAIKKLPRAQKLILVSNSLHPNY